LDMPQCRSNEMIERYKKKRRIQFDGKAGFPRDLGGDLPADIVTPSVHGRSRSIHAQSPKVRTDPIARGPFAKTLSP